MIDLSLKENVLKEKEQTDKKTRLFSLIRFLLGCAIIVFIICLITLKEPLLYSMLSLGSIAVLIIFCILTNPTYHHLAILKNMELVYQKHENRRKLSYRSFPDGKEFINYEDYKELDLDLLGPRSLFQYLCNARSKEGRRKLARQLTNPVPVSKEYQNCILALAKSTESLKLEASIMGISNDAKDCEHSEILGITSKKIKLPLLGIIAMVASYLVLVALLVVLLMNSIAPYYVLFFIPINYFITRQFTKNEVFDLNANKYSELLEAYEVLAQDVLKIQLEDEYFKKLQNLLREELPKLSKFKSLFEMLSYRKNLILSIVGNGTIYMDYIISFLFNHRSKQLDSIERTLEALTALECMISFATIGMDQELYCQAEESDRIEIEQGYHPLVKNCVPNSFEIRNGVILTGSNMSGKTTFMRMLGINQILANAGGLVCAKSFKSPSLLVVTSLRATDILQEGISTFYAEVKRMKNIMTTAKEHPALVLVDEIFKGTNAKDRIYAAFEIIRKLQSFHTPFIITTHDFELCEAEGIQNYHFDETYQNDQISFDYQIKSGRCEKTNAIYLLKMAGVLENKEN